MLGVEAGDGLIADDQKRYPASSQRLQGLGGAAIAVDIHLDKGNFLLLQISLGILAVWTLIAAIEGNFNHDDVYRYQLEAPGRCKEYE